MCLRAVRLLHSSLFLLRPLVGAAHPPDHAAAGRADGGALAGISGDRSDDGAADTVFIEGEGFDELGQPVDDVFVLRAAEPELSTGRRERCSSVSGSVVMPR